MYMARRYHIGINGNVMISESSFFVKTSIQPTVVNVKKQALSVFAFLSSDIKII